MAEPEKDKVDDFVAQWKKREEEERSKETAEEIANRFKFLIAEKLYDGETLTALVAIHAHLIEQLKTIDDPTQRLALARQAREAFKKIEAENTEKALKNLIENDWPPAQRERYYHQHEDQRPVGWKPTFEEWEKFFKRHPERRPRNWGPTYGGGIADDGDWVNAAWRDSGTKSTAPVADPDEEL